MSNSFMLPKSFESVKGSKVQAVSQFSTLKTGRHLVSVFAVLALQDHEKVGRYNPTSKSYPIEEKEGFLAKREWVNNSSQLAVVYKNETGVITEYYNLEGFMVPEDVLSNMSILKSEDVMRANGWTAEFASKITQKHIIGCKSGDSTYACLRLGKPGEERNVRIIDPKKTASCHSILSQVLVASGESVDSDLFEAIQNFGTAVTEGEDIIVDIEVGERFLSADVKARMAKSLDSVYEVKKVRSVDPNMDYSHLVHTEATSAPSMEDELDDVLG
jgi:hypothetical protein